MKKILTVVLVAIFAAASLASFAQKPKIAVLSIDNKTQYWHGQLGPAVEDWFVDELVASGKFTVIEREKLAAVMQEQHLSLSGAVDEKSAVSVGKLLGCQLILTGAVTDFSVKKASAAGGFGIGFSGSKTTTSGTLNMRLINTTNAEIVYSAKETGEDSSGKLYVAGFGGGEDFDESKAKKIFEPAVKKMVAAMVGKVDEIKGSLGSVAALSGKIAKISDGKVYISIGSTDGVKEGDIYDLYRLGEQITDPDSGKVLGQEKSKIGSFTVTKIVAEHLSIGVTEGGSAQVGDLVQKK